MKNPYAKLNQSNLSLADLIEAVSSVAKNNGETIAAVSDLINSGRVRIASANGTRRIKLA
ncbi:MAG: hypothetical protein WA771_03570 [Chthoniobacterales bacterium]